MVLPPALLVLDVYPLRRLGGRWRDWVGPAARAVWLEKIPFAVLGVAGAAVTYYAQNANSFITPLERYPLTARPAMVFYSLWFYLEKTVMPLGLSPLYELPARVSLLDRRFLLPAVAVTAITATVVLLRRRWPAGLAAWVYYAIALGPVIGIVHSGHQLTNDRYSYLPDDRLRAHRRRRRRSRRPGERGRRTPACAGENPGRADGAYGWAGSPISAPSRSRSGGIPRTCGDTRSRSILTAPSATETSASTCCTRDTIRWRRTSSSASRRCAPTARRCTCTSDTCTRCSASSPAAVDNFRQFIARYPNDVEGLNNLGAALVNDKRPREALEPLQRALKLKPRHSMSHAQPGLRLQGARRPAAGQEPVPRGDHPASTTCRRRGTDSPALHLQTGHFDAAHKAWGLLGQLDPALAGRFGPAFLQTW